MPSKNELKVFIGTRDTCCDECGEELGKGRWFTLDEKVGCLCLSCAELNHLPYLPAGDAALTRRARKYSRIYAVVLRWARARKRYERKGLLVEQAALERAEAECLEDADVRERRREREAARRAQLDQEYVEAFAARVHELYPGCPQGREHAIAEHACLKHSGRVGRSAVAKELDPAAVRLAVIAHIRHCETDYDEILMRTGDRAEARAEVRDRVDRVLADWQQ